MGPVGKPTIGIPDRLYNLFDTLRPPDHKGSEWGGGLNTLRATAAPCWEDKEGGEPEVCYAFFYSSLTVWETSVWKREMG